MAEVLWSLTAGTDLEEIENYIARDSIAHALHFVDRLIEAADRLALVVRFQERRRQLPIVELKKAA